MKSTQTIVVLTTSIELNHDGTDRGYRQAQNDAIDRLEGAGFKLVHLDRVIEVGDGAGRSTNKINWHYGHCWTELA